MKTIEKNVNSVEKQYVVSFWIFLLLSLVCFTFYLKDISIKKDKEFVQNIINTKVIPFTFEKKGVKTVINSLEINVRNNDIIANVNLDISSPLYNLKNKNGTLNLSQNFYNNTIFLQINSVSLNDLTFTEVKNEVIDNTEKVVNKKVTNFLKNKLYMNNEAVNNLKDKYVGEKIDEKVSEIKNKYLNEEKMKVDLYNFIKKQEIRVYDLGLKGLFIKDIKFNDLDNDNYDIEVVLNGGKFCLISGFMLLFGCLMIFIEKFRFKLI